MCSLIIRRHPGEPWPLLIAANRDELQSRPWRPPGRHWPNRPQVVGGLDVLAGGSWLGINNYGVVAAILNRVGSLGPAIGKRSRGELVLQALDHTEARAAAAALSDLDPNAYRPFNLVVADATDAYWLRNAEVPSSLGFRTASGTGREIDPARMPGTPSGDPTATIDCRPVPPGLSMITARDLNDLGSARISHYLPRFRTAPTPDPASGDWRAWIELLADHTGPDGDPRNGMTIVTEGDFGTVCSHLVAVPTGGTPLMRFAPGRPGEAAFVDVDL